MNSSSTAMWSGRSLKFLEVSTPASEYLRCTSNADGPRTVPISISDLSFLWTDSYGAQGRRSGPTKSLLYSKASAFESGSNWSPFASSGVSSWFNALQILYVSVLGGQKAKDKMR